MENKIIYSKDLEQVEVKPKLDLSLFKKRGNSKTYSGYLIQKMKEATQEGNRDVAALIQHFYQKYQEFQHAEQVYLENWKGKSSIQIIEEPDKFIVITFQKPDKDSAPEEIKREITKEEVNHISQTINKLNKGQPIPTREIGEFAYNRAWDDIFSDRHTHTQLNLILRLLDKKGQIKYRGGRSLVI